MKFQNHFVSFLVVYILFKTFFRKKGILFHKKNENSLHCFHRLLFVKFDRAFLDTHNSLTSLKKVNYHDFSMQRMDFALDHHS